MKFKILYTGLVCTLLCLSCQKNLDQYPSNGVSTDIVFNNPGDFDLAVRGMYGGLRGAVAPEQPYGTAYLGGEAVLFGDILSDNMIIVQSGRKSFQDFNRWTYASNATSNLFKDAYLVIRRANSILANIEKLPSGAHKDNVKAEALAIRAMCHFDVLRMYAKRYDVTTEQTDLGIPYVTSIDANLLPARNTMKSSYEHIIADFVEAEGLMNVSNGIGRLNRAAVAGLLSRVYLNKSDWQNAAGAADRSLAGSPGLSDDPGSLTDVSKIFTDETEKGVLFKIKMLDGDGVKIGYYYSQTFGNDGIKSEYVPTFNFYKMYAANDVRKAAYFNTSLYTPAGNTYNHVAKWLQRPTGIANILDFKVLRVAEVLLNKAEAYAQNSPVKNETKALDALNQLRQNRYTGFLNGAESGVALLAEIDKQRRLELAFEGHRFYDLKRKKVSVVRDAVHGEFSDGSGTKIPTQYTVLPANAKAWYLPFPQTEIKVNKNLLQDPEWR